MTAKQDFETKAQAWADAGRPSQALSSGYRLIALRSWAWSEGGKAEGVSALLKEFIQASEAAQPRNWLDAYFDDRESCTGCGESYRFENVALCTACSRKYCYKCPETPARAANGNRACVCGAGELVG